MEEKQREENTVETRKFEVLGTRGFISENYKFGHENI